MLSTGFVAYNDHYAFALQQNSSYRWKRFSKEVTKIFLFRDLLNHWLVKMAESGKLRRIIGKYEKVRSKQQYFIAKYKYTIV